MSASREIVAVLKEHARANVALHMANIEIYLSNPAGIGEHSDILEAVQGELDKAAVHKDRLDLLEDNFEEYDTSDLWLDE